MISGFNLPGALIVDLGLRQKFTISRTLASFRAVLSNVFDKKTWKVVAPNTIYVDERRRFMLLIAADL